MKRNFKIEHGVEIWKDYIFIDLHNLYELNKIILSKANKLLYIIFCRNKYPEPKSLKLPSKTMFVFRGIQHIEISDNFYNRDIKQLEEIGFKSPNDQNLDWLIPEAKSEKDDHIIFRFEEDEYIRISCDEAHFR
jgi:hypothetical protein